MTTSDPYVPTTEEVRAEIRCTSGSLTVEEFDRWLESLLTTAGADTLRNQIRAALEQLPEGGLSLWTDSRALNRKRVADALEILDRADSMEGKAHDQ